MSDDKRKVSTDALETLGTIIGPDEKRDAIHLAVVPIKARTILRAGDNVNAEGLKERPYVGIVDPFLKAPVDIGKWFWLVIYPRQITSLRHVWSHPAFPEESKEVAKTYDSAESAMWLLEWVKNSECPSYELLLEVGRTGSAKGDEDYPYRALADDEYLTVYGRDACGDIPPEVWDHVENVIGRKVLHRPAHFSCTC